MAVKTCYRCGETKSLEDFKNRPSSPDGKRNDCRACSRERESERRKRPDVAAQRLAYQRQRRKARYTPELGREHNLASKYRISVDTYNAMLAAQGGVCAICGSDNGGKHLAIDHDHACCADSRRTCGKCIRGLLCTPCNKGIGHFSDTVERLRNAISYLEAWNG